MDAHAKCRAAVRGCRSAWGRDFQKAEAVCLAAVVLRDAWDPLDARERYPAPQPLVALRKAVYSPASLRRAEQVPLRAARQEPQDEWASAREAQRA